MLLTVFVLIVLGCSNAAAFNASKVDLLSPKDVLDNARSNLFPSTWPLDHGDSARSKYVVSGGFSEDVRSDDLKFIANENLDNTQWLYTAGEGSKYLYVIHGRTGNFKLSKLSSTTLESIQMFTFPGGLYTGGLLIHGNGNVYAIYSNRLFCFYQGDLTNHTYVEVPTSLNSGMVQTNGMLVTSDVEGLLVIKQWPWTIKEVILSYMSETLILKLMIAIMVVSFTALMYFTSSKRGWNKKQGEEKDASKGAMLPRWISRTLKCGFYSALITVLIINVITYTVFVKAVRKDNQNLLRYIVDGIFSPTSGGGELKLVDPLTLQVRAAITLPEKCSYARMALSSVKNPSTGEHEDAIVLLGDEHVHQVRWSHSTQSLHWIRAWSRRYRRGGQGTFPGTGPSIYDGRVFFTDNTFAVLLGQKSYTMFSMDLDIIPALDEEERVTFGAADKSVLTLPAKVSSEHYVSSVSTDALFPPSNTVEHFLPTGSVSLTLKTIPSVNRENRVSLVLDDKKDMAGFMFWSVTVLPFTNNTEDSSNSSDRPIGLALVWDTAGRTVQARDIRDIRKLVWVKEGVIQADCLTALPYRAGLSKEGDREGERRHGVVYMTDYDFGPEHTNEWMGASVGSIAKYTLPKKSFLVVDGQTGKEIVRAPIPYGKGTNPSLLVPGANNDVFLGSQKGVIRIYA